jgi:uncharacterized cupredoxin-like copper-binding protein
MVVAAIVLAATLSMYGCGSGGGDPHAASASVPIKERDFKISAPRTLPSGRVDLSVDNTGPDDHELIIVRADHVLPRRADGLTVDEDSIEKQTVGTLEPGLGARDVNVDLSPGRYVMFCNMQGHYLGGMRRAFQVR